MSDYKKIILWGADFLGRQVRKWCEQQHIEVLSFWDQRADTLKSIQGIKVCLPFTRIDDASVCICVGNRDLRQCLREQAEERGFSVLSENESTEIFREALGDVPSLPERHNLESMTQEERISAAFDFAASSDYLCYDIQKYWRERVRLAKSLFFCYKEIYESEKEFWSAFIKNNGLHNLAGICSHNGGSFLGYPLVSLDFIQKQENAFVLLCHDWEEMEIRLKDQKIPYCTLIDHERCVFDSKFDSTWFRNEKSKALTAFKLLHDDNSRETFVEVLCNRIAPQFANKRYAQLKSNLPIYFNSSLFPIEEHECLVDAGAFTGDSLLSFLDFVNHKFDAIYAFEFDQKSFNILKKNVSTVLEKNKIFCIPKGVSDKKGICLFSGSEFGGYSINNFGDQNAELVSLDEELEGRRITWIKMDIEGSEMRALHGAVNIIKKYKPKCTVSTYHHISDLWNIPLFLVNLHSNYNFSIVHHTENMWDTVYYIW